MTKHFVARTLTLLGIALCILGLRIFVIEKYGENIPYWDPLPKEIDMVDAPFLENRPWLDGFLRPHNEHRIYTSLAVNAGLTIAAGQWDGRAQAIVSSLIFIAINLGLLIWAERNFRIGTTRLLAQVSIVFLALSPVGWENIISGFQSQFYFVIGLSLLALHASIYFPALSIRWWLGQVCGVLAIFSMGSGHVWAIPVIAWSLFKIAFPESVNTRWDSLPSAIAASAVLLLGQWLSFSPPGHERLHAHSLSDFLLYLVHCLAWPTPGSAWVFILWVSPGAILVGALFVQRRMLPRDWFILALLTWILIQVVGLSYARGAGGGYPAFRYADLFCLLLIAQTFALAALFEELLEPRWLSRGLVIIWPLALLGSLCALTVRTYKRDLPEYHAALYATAENLRYYLRTHDFERIRHSNIPLPAEMADMVPRILDRSGTRKIMPEAIRQPTPLIYRDAEVLRGGVTIASRDIANQRFGTLWGTFGQVASGHDEIESEVIYPDGLDYWRIYLSGTGLGKVANVKFKSANSGEILSANRIALAEENEWRRTYVRVPNEPFRFVVPAQPSGEWIGWTSPVEVSALSYWTEYVVRRWNVIIVLGAVLWIVGIGLCFFSGRAPESGSSTKPVRI